MNFLRLLISGSLVALAAPLSCSAQQKAAYSDTDAGQHAGEEAVVTGKIANVSKSGKGTTYVNFGDRFPKQTFSGVVFAGDAEKVGDMKQYEGKTVALTGRIELSPDQKPQIVIKSPGQIKLADGAPVTAAAPPAPLAKPMPATPAPAPSTAAPPAPAPAPAVPAAVASLATKPAPSVPAKKIALAANWNSPTQGGDMTRKDLAMLFGTVGSASEKTEGDTSIVVYPDIPFLTPLAAAKKTLNLENAASSKMKVSCPGMPLGSFSAYVFGGIFPGGFNRLYLVTDNADQVISVLLVDENSRQRSAGTTDNSGYHTYNFINFRVKGTNDLVIKHELAPDAPAGVVLVESLLIDPKDQENAPKTSKSFSSSKSSSSSSRTPRTGKVLERSHWYVPLPVVNLILRCVGSR